MNLQRILHAMIAMGLRRLQASCYKWSYMLAPKVWVSHLEIVTLFEGLVFAAFDIGQCPPTGAAIIFT